MARQNIMNNILVTSSSAQKYWLDKNNNSYEFSLKNFKELATLISKRDTKLYSIETEIKNAIKKLRSVKSLAAIIIPDLWRKSEENYQE
jgi:predicted patatin/cPLA2 family phospholipase